LLSTIKPGNAKDKDMTVSSTHYRNVIVCSGHMIDQPNRPQPRFPPHKEKLVRDRMMEQLQQWRVGAGDLAICGGAQGADILFAECCAALGAEVNLLISLPQTEFLQRSVHLEGADWESRYFALTHHSHISTYFQEDFFTEFPEEIRLIDNVFARNNLRMIETAQKIAQSGHLFAILVWDERETGDGPGGTSEFAARIQSLGGNVVIINPKSL
jgi:hypothetical protein